MSNNNNLEIQIVDNNDVFELTERENIANEVLIIKEYEKFKDDDFWNKTGDKLASKNKLIGWLNDAGNRSGIISLYFEDHPEHFDENGNWQPKHLVSFIGYVTEKLLDDDFISSHERLQEFFASIRDEDWFKHMINYSAYKMLEILRQNHALRSNYARDTLTYNHYLDELESIFYQYKNSGDSENLNQIEELLIKQREHIENRRLNHYEKYNEELRLYETYRKEIFEQLTTKQKNKTRLKLIEK